MPKVWRYAILITVLILVLALLLWRSPPQPLTQLFEDGEQPPPFPVTYFTQAETRQFDNNGQLEYQLNADEVVHFDPPVDNLAARFSKPQLTLFQQNNPPWQITADAATSTDAQEQLLLSGNVEIITGDNQQPTRLTTDSLALNLASQYAESDKPVIITDANGTIAATGMKVFFNQHRIELLSNVRSTHKLQ